MSDASEAFRRAYANNDSPEEREKAFEEATGNDISGPSDTDDDSTSDTESSNDFDTTDVSPSASDGDAVGGSTSNNSSSDSSSTDAVTRDELTGDQQRQLSGSDEPTQTHETDVSPSASDGDAVGGSTSNNSSSDSSSTDAATRDELAGDQERQLSGSDESAQTHETDVSPSASDGDAVGGSTSNDGSSSGRPTDSSPSRDPNENSSLGQIEQNDATRVGRLEDAAQNDDVQQRAQQLEQEVVGKNISDVSDKITQADATLGKDDVEVVRRDDKLVAQLSPVGRERLREIQAEENVEQSLEEELGRQISDESVEITDDGSIQVDDEVRREIRRQAIADANPGVSESDVVFNANNEARILDDSGNTDVSPDMPATGRRRELSDEELQAEEERIEQASATVPGFVPVLGGTEVSGQARDVEVRQTATGEVVVEEQERYGDIDYSAGLGGQEDEVEQAVDSLPEQASGAVRPASRAAFNQSDSAGEEILRALGKPELGRTYEKGAKKFGGEILPQTAAGVASVPGAALEGAELVNEVARNPERAEELPDAAGGAAAQTANAAASRPETVGAGLVGGGAVGIGFGRFLGTTSLATGRTGTILRAADVDPGSRAARLAKRGVDAARRRTRGDADADTGPVPSGRSDVGTGGSGSLLDADAVDDAMGVSGPSRRSRARRRVQESDLASRINAELERFRADESGQLGQGRQRRPGRDGGSGDDFGPADSPADRDPTRPDDAGGTFDDVRQDALTQQQDYLTDMRSRERQARGGGGLRDSESTEGRTRPGSERTSRGAQRRRRQAEEPQATVDDSLDPGAVQSSGLVTAGGTAVGFASTLVAAQRQRLQQAQRSAVTEGADVAATDLGGVGPRSGLGSRTETRTQPAVGERTRLGSLAEVANRQDTGTRLTPEQTTTPEDNPRNPDDGRVPNRPSDPDPPLTPDPEPPLRPERRPPGPPDEPDDMMQQPEASGGQSGGSPFGGDRGAEAGWYNEFTAALAGTDRSAAAGIEDQADESLADFGALAVASQDTDEFQETAGFLSGEGTAIEGFGGGDDGLL